jgi:hypothetical protein
MPSASNAHPPIIAGMTSQGDFLRTKENSAKIPPSPRLSALRVIITYLIVVCSVKVQKMHDKPPSIKSGVIVSANNCLKYVQRRSSNITIDDPQANKYASAGKFVKVLVF